MHSKHVCSFWHMFAIKMGLCTFTVALLFLSFYSLHQSLEWKTSPPATHLNHNHLPPLPPSHPRAQPPLRNRLLLHPRLFLPHPTPSTLHPHHKMLTVPITPCHTHPVTPTKCKLTIIPKEGPTMDRASRPRTPISPLRIPPSSSSQASTYQGLAEERPTKTKTKNKDSSCGTAWNVRFDLWWDNGHEKTVTLNYCRVWMCRWCAVIPYLCQQ